MTSILRHISPALLPVIALGLGVACSSSTTQQTPGGGEPGGTPTTPVNKEECSARCKSKLSACGAPAPQTEQGCATLCDGSYSAEQVSCFQSKDCEELARAESVEDLCPSTPAGTVDAGPTVKDASTAEPQPSKLEITARFGTAKATHVLDRDKNIIVSLLSLAPTPSFRPAAPRDLPQLDKGRTIVKSPALGACKASLRWTLNPSQISVVISGTDALPDASCSKFTDAIVRDGLEVTIEDAPYTNGSATATVSVDLSP